MSTRMTLLLLCAATTWLGHAGACAAAEPAIRRTLDPGVPGPYASAVAVPANTEYVFISGTLADVANPDAPKGSLEAYGNTTAQATSVLRKIDKLLAAQGLTMGDVVKVNVYLAGDPGRKGKVDFAGMNAAYARFFGSASQPNKATRTTVAVAALPRAGALVEIEMTAARTVAPAGALSGPAALVQTQFEAYNARDMEAFLATYADDAELFGFAGQIEAKGKDEMRMRYGPRFRDGNLHGMVVERIVMGNTVIDHERVRVTLADGPGVSEGIAIYEVRDGKIAKVTFIRGQHTQGERL